jgi:hypothetical protein
MRVPEKYQGRRSLEIRFRDLAAVLRDEMERTADGRRRRRAGTAFGECDPGGRTDEHDTEDKDEKREKKAASGGSHVNSRAGLETPLQRGQCIEEDGGAKSPPQQSACDGQQGEAADSHAPEQTQGSRVFIWRFFRAARRDASHSASNISKRPRIYITFRLFWPQRGPVRK